MLPFNESGTAGSAIVLFPFLGGSQREWTETVNLLSPRHRCITIDLPGFGAAADLSGYSVNEMCDAVIECLASLRLTRYILVGHSMGGKVSAVVSRRLIEEASAVAAPMGLVLVAPSPPSPEPMSDTKRAEMLASLGSDVQLRRKAYAASDRTAAEKFIRDNIAEQLSNAIFERTVDDVLAMNPKAWTAWLTSGSKEDWTAIVGMIDLPTLVIAGRHDEALGPEAQRTHTLPHFSRADLAELDCCHLVPLERPSELTGLILSFLNKQQIEDNV